MNAKIRLAILILLLSIVFISVWFLLRQGTSQVETCNVILISIDTCRADHLGCYGFSRNTTPNIDAFAEDAVLFKHAVTPVPLTLPAHSSMLTGTNPPYHGVHTNTNYRLEESITTIAEILQQAGYNTGAIVSSFVLDSQFGLNQGFDSYNDEFVKPLLSLYYEERRGGEASHFACEWLERHRKEPAFLFLHYFDPHDEYIPPEPFATTFKDNLYAGEIAYVDHCIGQVIEKLKDLGIYDSALIIITSDHGEGLGEHSEETHGFFIYQSCVHVPMIVKVPAGPKGKRVNELVGLIDIAPTICGMLGITPPSDMHGKDLSGFLRKKGKSDQKNERYMYCESLLATQYNCNGLLGVVGDRWKYIQAPREELYDLDKDPGEQENLADKDPKRVRLLKEHLKLILQDQMRNDISDSRFALDEESKKRLESLGYVAAGHISEDFKFDDTKDDPKDWIGLHQKFVKARYLIRAEKYLQAKTICKQILAERPEAVFNYYLLGKINHAQNYIDESIQYFSKFLSLLSDANDPVSIDRLHRFRGQVYEVHHRLGNAFSEQKNFDEAIFHYSKALQIRPFSPRTHYDLGNAYLESERYEDAILEYERAVELNYPEARCNLGIALFKLGRLDETIQTFQEALRWKPDWAQVRRNLAVAEKKKAELGGRHEP